LAKNVEIAAVAEDPRFTVQQAADYMGVQKRTMQNWMHLSRIEFIKIMGGPVRIRKSTLDAILAAGVQEADERVAIAAAKKRVRPVKPVANAAVEVA